MNVMASAFDTIYFPNEKTVPLYSNVYAAYEELAATMESYIMINKHH